MTLAVLVYQCGLANVFDATAGNGIARVYQGDYRGAEHICRGLILAGVSVHVCHADVCGDVAVANWEPGKGDLWEDRKHPPEECHAPSAPYVFTPR